MKHYIDITLLPDAEASLGFIWEKVYQQIHLALVDNKTANGNSVIAVSFPEYGKSSFPLGTKLRLLAPSNEVLQELGVAKWLSRLTDYCHFTSIKPVPMVTTFVNFSRKQGSSNAKMVRLVRRRIVREGETLDQAIKFYADHENKHSKLPFINMLSLSTQESINVASRHQFKLFIDMKLEAKAYEGEFNCYGLSKTSTIPWF